MKRKATSVPEESVPKRQKQPVSSSSSNPRKQKTPTEETKEADSEEKLINNNNIDNKSNNNKKKMKKKSSDPNPEEAAQVRGLIAPDGLNRCHWGGAQLNEKWRSYHDEIWGAETHDDQLLFEMLSLGGFQAGLGWGLVFNKRAAFRKAFANFEVEKVAKFTPKRLEELGKDEGIIRNKAKIASVVNNAIVTLKIKEEFGSLDKFLWGFIDHKPIINNLVAPERPPVQSPKSLEISKAMKKHGFKFVGPVIIYAFMETVGMVNDHHVHCFRHPNSPDFGAAQKKHK